MELSFDPAKWQFLWLYSLNFERISSLEPTLELRSRVRRSHCAASRPPHTRARLSAAANVFRDAIVARGGRH